MMKGTTQLARHELVDDDAARMRRAAMLTLRYKRILAARQVVQCAGMLGVFLTVIAAGTWVVIAVIGGYIFGLAAAQEEMWITRLNAAAITARSNERAAMIADVRHDLEHGPPHPAGTEWFLWNIGSWVWWGSLVSDLTYTGAVGYAAFVLSGSTALALATAIAFIALQFLLVVLREVTNKLQKRAILYGILMLED